MFERARALRQAALLCLELSKDTCYQHRLRIGVGQHDLVSGNQLTHQIVRPYCHFAQGLRINHDRGLGKLERIFRVAVC